MIYGTPDARLREGETAAMPPLDPSSVGDVFSTAFDAQLKAYNLNSALATKEQAFDETIDGIFELTGQRLENPMRAPWIVVENGIRVPRRSDPVVAFEQRIADLANEQPDKSRDILAFRGSLERAYQKRNAAVRQADDATMRSQWTGNVPLLGPVNPIGIAGGLAGSMLDPATLIVNAVGSAGQGGKILFHALRSALINAGAEVAQQPFIKQWANEAGDPYGWDDAARSVAAAALLGGALDAGIRGGYRGVQTARGLEPVRESGLITGWRSPEEKIAALDDAAPRLPEDNPVRRAAEGDIAAVREIAEKTGAIDDPALRGEIIAREMADGLEGPPPMDVDAGDGFARLAQALRSATDPEEPPFNLPMMKREQRVAVAAEAIARTNQNRTHQALLEGAPTDAFNFSLSPIDIDAALDMWRYVQEMRNVARPERLVDWLKRTGGLQEDAGELRHMLGAYNRRPGLVSKKGRNLDDATLAAWQEGYLAGVDRPEINDLLNAISSDLADEPIVRQVDRALLDEFAELASYERDLDDLGILRQDTEAGARAALERGSPSAAREGEAGRFNSQGSPQQARPTAEEVAPRLVDVAGAEAKAQVDSLERGLASSIERAQKPELRAERAASLAQIRREPSRPAKSLGESLKGVSIDAPAELFHWLGIKPARFQANYEKISAKRRERPSLGVNLSEPSAVRTFVEDVLSTAEVAIVTGDGAHWDLIARNGRDSVVGARLEMKGGRYNIETALVLDEGQLARRLAGAIRERGLDGLKWRDAEAASTILELIRRDVALREHPSAQRVITALERSQDGLADIAISEGRYLHAHPATARMAEIRAEIDRTVKMLPRDVRLRVVDRLEFGGREANGAWDGYDRIVYASLSAVDPVRTVRHETIHALRQSGLMTDQEFDTLYAFAERAGLRQAYGIDKHYGELYGKAYPDRGAAGVEALLREETIADMFADYSLNGRRFADEFGRQGRTIDKVLDLIVKFLKQVRDALHVQGFKDVRDIFEAIETGSMAARDARRATLPGGLEVEGIELFSLKAFHGTPHTFAPEEGAPAGRFRSSQIGTGEGAQAFGHGLYFAESEGVARSYRDALSLSPGVQVAMQGNNPLDFSPEGKASARLREAFFKYGQQWFEQAAVRDLNAEIASLRGSRLFGPSKAAKEQIAELQAIKQLIEDSSVKLDVPEHGGRIYEVNINAEPEQFLDWDGQVSKQPDLLKAVKEAGLDPSENASGAWAYNKLSAALAPKVVEDNGWTSFVQTMNDEVQRRDLAADLLREKGFVGVRYLDQGSRGGSGKGTSNFVIFPGNEHLIEIVAVDGQPVVNLAADLADAKRETGLGKVVEACRF